MDVNQHQSANHIIEFLNDIQVDGETMEYIVEGTNLTQQLFRQLFLKASDLYINDLLNERLEIHDKGSNSQFNN
jgi:hypothetical protein